MCNATARLWMFKNVVTCEGHPFRRFCELPLLRNESQALALSWTCLTRAVRSAG